MIKCTICSKEFLKRKSMTNHRRWHKIDKYKDYQETFLKNFPKARRKLFQQRRIVLIDIEINGGFIKDKISYWAVHRYIKSILKRPELCQHCNKNKVHDLSNISNQYKLNLRDWEYLCRSCHMKKDGRHYNLNQYRGKNNENTL